MTPEHLLAQLGQAMNLPALTLDANGCARVVVDGRLSVNFEREAATGLLQLYAPVAPLPAHDREALFLRLLEGNLFCAQTLGATLAVDTLYNEVVLCRGVVPQDTDAVAFVALVERFIAAAQDWTEKLAAPAPGADGADWGSEGHLGRAGAAPADTAEAATAQATREAMAPRVQAHFLRV